MGHRAALSMVIALVVSIRASSETPPDWQVEFLQPVEEPVHVDVIPANMRNMMLLAVERAYNPDIKEDDPMLNPSIREQLRAQGFSIDGSFAGASPERERAANMQRIRKAHRSETVPLADDFEPGHPELWEKVSGGMVSKDCGSVEGEALCFDQDGERYVVSAPMRILGGASVRFGLWMSPAEEPHNVTLEYQTAGSSAWERVAGFNPHTYSLPPPSNPNSRWLEGGDTFNGFTFFSVPLTRAADSGATRIRWAQGGLAGVSADTQGAFPAQWALDNIEVELGAAERPAVILTVSEEVAAAGGKGAGWISVVAQFSDPVIAFDRLRIRVDGGTVASVNKLTGVAAGKGDMYTIAVAPDDGAAEVALRILEGAGITKRGAKSLQSNSIAVMVETSEDRHLAWVRQVSSAGIDLDATGMAEDIQANVAPGAWEFQGDQILQAVQELQARIEYLEREVRRLQQVETDVKYLKNALLQQFR